MPTWTVSSNIEEPEAYGSGQSEKTKSMGTNTDVIARWPSSRIEVWSRHCREPKITEHSGTGVGNGDGCVPTWGRPLLYATERCFQKSVFGKVPCYWKGPCINERRSRALVLLESDRTRLYYRKLISIRNISQPRQPTMKEENFLLIPSILPYFTNPPLAVSLLHPSLAYSDDAMVSALQPFQATSRVSYEIFGPQ